MTLLEQLTRKGAVTISFKKGEYQVEHLIERDGFPHERIYARNKDLAEAIREIVKKENNKSYFA